jgi:Protein of unknown function (DUF2726)
MSGPVGVKTLFAVIVIGAICLVVLLLFLKQRGLLSTAPGEQWPLYAKHPLTQVEQVLYHRLVRALPDHIVLAQVQVSRVLGVKKGHNFHEWNNRINRLSYDFVICTRDATVLAAIELDDRSHEAAARVATDDKKNKATAAAGVRLVRWQAKALPDEAAIRALFVPPRVTDGAAASA